MQTKLALVVGSLLLSSAALADTTGPDFVSAKPRVHIDSSLVASSGTSRIAPGDVVQFAYDKDQLTEAGYAQIDRAARWLKKHPQQRVVLEGHASTPGPVMYNDDLATRRINAIRNRFAQWGISTDRVVMVIYGEREQPADRRVVMYTTKLAPDAVAAMAMESDAAIASMWTVNGKLKVLPRGEAPPKVIATRR